MREICTSGSVRGEGGNILAYSALDQADDNSGEGNDIAASFDEITAALQSLDKQCK